jgi:hypothetical protein
LASIAMPEKSRSLRVIEATAGGDRQHLPDPPPPAAVGTE